jgi:hypothetical protein
LRTPSSLFLLLIVFVIFASLQLLPHHNSSTEKLEWEGWADTMDVLIAELEGIVRELDGFRQDHVGVRDAVRLLRRLLDVIRVRKLAREACLKPLG